MLNATFILTGSALEANKDLSSSTPHVEMTATHGHLNVPAREGRKLQGHLPAGASLQHATGGVGGGPRVFGSAVNVIPGI